MEKNGPDADSPATDQNWNSDDLGEQSSYEGSTEMDRRLRRENEAKGDPDARDVAGSQPENDMPHKRDPQ